MNTSATSKFLSYILRHHPESIGLMLDENGWADVATLLQKMNANNQSISFDGLQELVANNDKKRFIFNEDQSKIRASQGHSIEVNLQMQPTPPPATLYHGTASRFVEKIILEGLQKMSRQHVHLSATVETAITVGSRHGKPVVLCIQSEAMQRDGHLFYLSENNVWLTEQVPTLYITVLS